MERQRQSSMAVVRATTEKKEEEEKPKGPVKKNDIREIRNRRQLAKVNLDLDSPRMKEAMAVSGVNPEDLDKKEKSDFEKPGVDEDVANLRFKHYQARLIDLINELLFERRKIIDVQKKLDNRNQTLRSTSPGFPGGPVGGLALNQNSQAQMSKSPGSNMNLGQRPSQMNVFGNVGALQTPARRPSQMKVNDDLGGMGGGSFMTEIKQIREPSSRQLQTQSPDTRASNVRLNIQRTSATEMSPSPQLGFMSQSNSPAPQNMLVSFNFLTQVPIEEFVVQEHSKASKLSARLKSNASMKIERELERKIKENEQRARLDKVLAAAQLKLKTDVETLKKRESEKREAVNANLEAMRRKERIALRQADKKREAEDMERAAKLELAKKNKMAQIMASHERSRVAQSKVEDFRQRMQSEEAQRIKDKLVEVDQKVSKSNARNRECLTMRVDTVRRRNQSLSEKLNMFRTAEQITMQETIETAKENSNQRTARMKVYYKQEKNKWQAAKNDRQEAFDYNRSRQGDNSQAIKQRNRQIMIKLKRSQKQVEEFMRAQNHELMLKQELRKLREEDILKKKIREKRKELGAKQQIIKKEQDDEKLLKTMRDREQILIQTRHTNMMQGNLEKVSHIEGLEKWVKRGFSTSRSVKKQVNLGGLHGSPRLEKLSKQAASPVKIKEAQVEDI